MKSLVKFLMHVGVIILGIACVVMQAKVVCYGYNKFLVPLGLPSIAWKVMLGILIILSMLKYRMTPQFSDKEMASRFISAIIFFGLSYLVMCIL